MDSSECASVNPSHKFFGTLRVSGGVHVVGGGEGGEERVISSEDCQERYQNEIGKRKLERLTFCSDRAAVLTIDLVEIDESSEEGDELVCL